MTGWDQRYDIESWTTDVPADVVELTITPNGPPDDPITALTVGALWHHFTIHDSEAWVLRMSRGTFLLHWIESHGQGEGGMLLDAIGAWADDLQLVGHLVCVNRLVDFYCAHDWQRTEPFPFDPSSFTMERLPMRTVQGRRVTDIETSLL